MIEGIDFTPRYEVRVLEVHSGDDLSLEVDLGLDNLSKKVRARLKDVDTPDAFKAQPDSKAYRIKQQVWNKLRGKRCVIEVHSMETGRKGWIVTLYFEHGDGKVKSLNESLIQQGYIFKRNRR